MRKAGGVPIVDGDDLRALREAVRFTTEPYSSIAKRFGYKTAMGPLKAAKRYERDKGLEPEQKEEVEGAAIPGEPTKAHPAAPVPDGTLAA